MVSEIHQHRQFHSSCVQVVQGVGSMFVTEHRHGLRALPEFTDEKLAPDTAMPRSRLGLVSDQSKSEVEVRVTRQSAFHYPLTRIPLSFYIPRPALATASCTATLAPL